VLPWFGCSNVQVPFWFKDWNKYPFGSTSTPRTSGPRGATPPVLAPSLAPVRLTGSRKKRGTCVVCYMLLKNAYK
jgi:hypothetical protein